MKKPNKLGYWKDLLRAYKRFENRDCLNFRFNRSGDNPCKAAEHDVAFQPHPEHYELHAYSSGKLIEYQNVVGAANEQEHSLGTPKQKNCR